MNPNPGVFGPHFWFVLHSVSFFYPEYPDSSDMRRHKEFYESFVYMIPCDECKKHYRVLLTRYPIDGHLDNREQLSRWVVFIHNKVNEKLNKPTMAYDDVVRYYRNAYLYNPNAKFSRKTKNISFGIILLLALFLCYERFYMKNKLF
mgnify:CR=1 FL=1